MSDPVAFRLQLDVTAKSEAVVTDFCIAHLRERGFNVARPHKRWEKVNELCRRLRVSYMTVQRALGRSDRPTVIVKRGQKTDRIIEILSNKEFDAFLTRNKKRPNRQSRPPETL